MVQRPVRDVAARPLAQPMLASLADAPLSDPNLIYEPKYDGIRAIAEVHADPDSPSGARVRLWSRLGHDKALQFPEVTRALERWAKRLKLPTVLDGEVVALDSKGGPAGFQVLQRSEGGSALILFDLLREDGTDYREQPLVERRAALERLFARASGSAATNIGTLRLSLQQRGDARDLYRQAVAHGWEGLIAKRADSTYKSGKRSPDWCKLKISREQEFVIGGWTEPRGARSHFGSLLIGVHRRPGDPTLVYAGHVGTGFNERELRRLVKLLKPIETDACPFDGRPPSNERPHWVKPTLVAQVKFTEWTADGILRHPVYLGMRDDKKPEDVVREKQSRLNQQSDRAPAAPVKKSQTGSTRGVARRPEAIDATKLLEQLKALEDQGRDGVLMLPDGDRLNVTNLRKIFWPKLKLTKGDLFRYYVQVAPYILPVVDDRPLVMKRFPNGISGQPFYQHLAGDLPSGVRTYDQGSPDGRAQIVGDSLKTLLYMTQLAAISQDPWFSRASTPEFPDMAAIDLDPAEGITFKQVLEIARAVHEELDTLGATGVPKTSGSRGLHVYVRLPPRTPFQAGEIFCQIIATVVAHKHPKLATVERKVKARGRKIYVDYMQNGFGKTLAAAYSARASEWAGVSTPLTWKEVHDGIDREAFTILTAPARFRKVGDLWAALRTAKPVDLSSVKRYR